MQLMSLIDDRRPLPYSVHKTDSDPKVSRFSRDHRRLTSTMASQWLMIYNFNLVNINGLKLDIKVEILPVYMLHGNITRSGNCSERMLRFRLET